MRGDGPTAVDLEQDALLALATAVALEAGAMALAGRRRGGFAVDTKSSPTDPVTELDRAVEQLVVDRLLAARPADGVLGEEGAARTGTSGLTWVVDPIDGTTNFVYDRPDWAVSIAARRDGVDLVAVVHAPVRGHTWTATADGPAHRDGQPVACSTVDTLGQALIGTGFAYDGRRRGEQGRVVAAVLPRVRDVRRSGAASLDLCAVADGRLDGYYEQGLGEWDLAAGALVARRAGARLGGLRPDGVPTWLAPHWHGLVLTAGPALFDPLRQLLADAKADPGGVPGRFSPAPDTPSDQPQ